jgi:hypothetical protein
MNREQAIESFYFAVTPQHTISSLAAEFPMLFTAKPITPINFSLHMDDASQELRSKSSRSSNERSEKPAKFSAQPAQTKFNLKKKLLSEILANKSAFKIFDALTTIEDRSIRIWLYIDKRSRLQGSYNCNEIQKIFEQGSFEPNTQIKTKLSENWSTMQNLLAQYTKISLLQRFESGFEVEKSGKGGESTISTAGETAGIWSPINEAKLSSCFQKKCSVDAWMCKTPARPATAIKSSNGKYDIKHKSVKKSAPGVLAPKKNSNLQFVTPNKDAGENRNSLNVKNGFLTSSARTGRGSFGLSENSCTGSKKTRFAAKINENVAKAQMGNCQRLK